MQTFVMKRPLYQTPVTLEFFAVDVTFNEALKLTFICSSNVEYWNLTASKVLETNCIYKNIHVKITVKMKPEDEMLFRKGKLDPIAQLSNLLKNH